MRGNSCLRAKHLIDIEAKFAFMAGEAMLFEGHGHSGSGEIETVAVNALHGQFDAANTLRLCRHVNGMIEAQGTVIALQLRR